VIPVTLFLFIDWEFTTKQIGGLKMARIWNNDETRPVENTRAKVYIDGAYLGECNLKVNVEWERSGPTSTPELFVSTPKEPEVIVIGEGYRLLGPGEKLYPGDEVYDNFIKAWVTVVRQWDVPSQCEQISTYKYRRRNRFQPTDVVVCTATGFDVYGKLGTVVGPDGALFRVIFMTSDGPITRAVSGNHLAPVPAYRAAKYQELLQSYDKVKAEKDKADLAAASAGITLQNILSQFKGI
jgi:hypothetical protein